MTYPAYEKYKESGVPWLGQVPEGWEVKKLRYAAQLSDKRVPYEDAECSYVGLEHIESWTGRRISDEEARAEGIVSLFESGNILFGKLRPYLAKVHLAEKKGCSSTEALVLRGSGVLDTHFLKYYMLSPAFIDEVNATTYGAKMPRANWADVGALPVCLPPVEKQKAIADFLDKKTAEIDALIAKKEELLKLLAEQRTALITHAVTKGLNPSAPMKDSGIDWLGHIPQHWHAKRLKFAVRLVNEKVEAASVDLAYMGLEQIESWTGKRIPNEEAISEGVVNVFQPNDVLFGKLRPYLAKVYLAKENATCSTEAFVLRSSKQLLPDFLQLYMLTDKFINAVDATTYGAKLPRANWESVGNLMILLPPLKEQETIVEHIRTNISRIEAVSNQVVKAINCLKEYRTALITNAVTGKIDVRGYGRQDRSLVTLTAKIIRLYEGDEYCGRTKIMKTFGS